MSLNEPTTTLTNTITTIHNSVEVALPQGIPNNAQMMMDISEEETAEMTQRRDQELGYELFGHPHVAAGVANHHTAALMLLSSPMIGARDEEIAVGAAIKKVSVMPVAGGLVLDCGVGLRMDGEIDGEMDVEMEMGMGMGSWGSGLRSPENVELEELEGMFLGF